MTKKQMFQISMSMIIFFLAFLCTWQIKGVRKVSGVNSQISNRIETLQQDYKTALEKNEDLLDQIVILQDDVARYREQLAQSGGAGEVMEKELKRAETAAGLTDVSGGGIVINISDGPKQVTGNYSSDDGYGIVHDSYILTILNELRAAGAEAISINDERILATSEIRCAGPTISINNVKKAAPFELKVIGDPDTLENALRMPYGAVDQAGYYGIEITIKKSNKLVIKKYAGLVSFKHAQVVEPEVTE